jgi:hypothetical protein
MIVHKCERGIFHSMVFETGAAAPSRPAHPAIPRLAASAAALKDASRRARARWPRKNEAILDRGSARSPGVFRPGRENGTPAEPENIDCGCALANASTATNGEQLCLVRAGRVCRLRLSITGGRIRVCVVFVSQGWGSVQFTCVSIFLRCRHQMKCRCRSARFKS